MSRRECRFAARLRSSVQRFSAVALLSLSSLPAATFFISPAGNDSNAGRTESSAWKSFARAFNAMAPGDELVLIEGTYSEAAGTGYISYLGEHSAQPPSGANLAAITRVRARKAGTVRIVGALWLGRSFEKCSYVSIEGITFEGGGALYNTSFVAVRQSGFHDVSLGADAVFGIGTNDGDWGNTNNLVEDVWIWGRDRAIASNYRADNNVWRRVVVRGDGCGSDACTGPGNPNVGITVYDSANISLQNVLVVDRILAGGDPYADFATAQHTPGRAFGNNEWLGTISLNSEDSCYMFEADETSLRDPAWRLHDAIGWNCTGTGLNASGEPDSATELLNGTFLVRGGGGIAVRVPAEQARNAVSRVIVTGTAHYATNIGTNFTYFDQHGDWTDGLDYAGRCEEGCKTSDPLQDGNPPSLRYLTRIEPGSLLKGATGGADIGANVVYRYGAAGTFSGQSGYNELTNVPLWPWPNEDLIRADLCAAETRGFCSRPSLTEYVWTMLGNPVPPDLVAGPQGAPPRHKPPIPVPYPRPILR